MFTRCLMTTRGSSLKKDKLEGHSGVWRHRVRSCLQHLWPFSRKRKTLTKGSQGQDHTDQSDNASAPQDQREPGKQSHISAEKVVKLVNNLVPSLQEGDPFFVPAFLSTYRSFVTPVQVLGLLFMRYAYFHPHSAEDKQVKNTLCSFLETWLDKNPEDFCEPSDLFPLEFLKAYLNVHVPNSDLLVRVNRLLTQLYEEQAKEPEAKDEEDLDLGKHTSSDPEIKRRRKYAWKPATLKKEPTCVLQQESAKATRRFCDTCINAARCGSSSPASTHRRSCGTWLLSCL